MSERLQRFPGRFTVLMPVYRGDTADRFEAALRSVYANSLRPDAVLLVIDGPVGDEIETIVVRHVAEQGLQVLRLPRNLGLASALNAALEQVRTEWVVRADADDENLPERFAALANAVQDNPSLGLLGSAILEVDAAQQPVARRSVPLRHEDIVRFARSRNPFNHMAVAFRAAAVKTAGGYPQLHLREDYGLWVTLLSQGVFSMNLPDVLVHATAGRDMYRRRGGWRYAKGEWQLQRHLVAARLKSPVAALVDGATRSLVFLMPAAVRGLVYEGLLRRRATSKP